MGADLAASASPPQRADLRRERSASTTAAAGLFGHAAAVDPRLRLFISGRHTPGPDTDRALLPAPEPRLAELGWRVPT
jgi:hypothetical protein